MPSLGPLFFVSSWYHDICWSVLFPVTWYLEWLLFNIKHLGESCNTWLNYLLTEEIYICIYIESLWNQNAFLDHNNNIHLKVVEKKKESSREYMGETYYWLGLMIRLRSMQIHRPLYSNIRLQGWTLQGFEIESTLAGCLGKISLVRLHLNIVLPVLIVSKLCTMRM